MSRIQVANYVSCHKNCYFCRSNHWILKWTKGWRTLFQVLEWRNCRSSYWRCFLSPFPQKPKTTRLFSRPPAGSTRMFFVGIVQLLSAKPHSLHHQRQPSDGWVAGLWGAFGVGWKLVFKIGYLYYYQLSRAGFLSPRFGWALHCNPCGSVRRERQLHQWGENQQLFHTIIGLRHTRAACRFALLRLVGLVWLWDGDFCARNLFWLTESSFHGQLFHERSRMGAFEQLRVLWAWQQWCQSANRAEDSWKTITVA